MNFAERLKELRMQRQTSQKDIANQIGISTTQYQNYEYGIHEPTVKNLISLADYFNVSIDYLVGRSDDRERR